MDKFKQAAGYLWAAAAFIAAMALMSSYEGLGRRLAGTGLKISPVFSGGEIVRTLDRGAYRVFIHRPVFDSLAGERSSGFVQVDWGPLEALPARMEENVDFDGDGRPDFAVALATAPLAASLKTSDPRVSAVGSVTVLARPRTVRLYEKPEPAGASGSMEKIAVRVLLRK